MGRPHSRMKDMSKIPQQQEGKEKKDRELDRSKQDSVSICWGVSILIPSTSTSIHPSLNDLTRTNSNQRTLKSL